MIFNDSTLKHIVRLKRDTSFRELLITLRKVTDTLAYASVRQQGIESNWTQGAAQFMDDMLKEIDSADMLLDERKTAEENEGMIA